MNNNNNDNNSPPPLPPRPWASTTTTTTTTATTATPPNTQQQPWQPPAGTTWNYVLNHPVRLDDHHTIERCQVWITDLFDTPEASVAELHRRGRRVVAYFSAGTREDWRPDAHLLLQAPSDLGRPLDGDGWAGERWLRTGSPAVRAVMLSRLDLAARKGFDGVDPDNVDGYDNDSGLGLSRDGAVGYVLWLAREARARGLGVGLKNAGDIAPLVVDHVQWCVCEQAVQYGEEGRFLPFIGRGKPVFHVEYPKGEDPDSDGQNDEREVTGRKRDRIVRAGRRHGFSTIIKNVRLDQWVQMC